MVTVKEKINHFKSELKSYRYYHKMYDELTLELEDINVKLRGVSSTPPKEVIAGAMSAKVYRSNILELMDQEEKLISQRSMYATLIKNIDDKLSKLNDEERMVLKRIFIDGKHYEDVAIDLYMSVSTLSRYISRTIKKIV